jgi:hypothetical protein
MRIVAVAVIASVGVAAVWVVAGAAREVGVASYTNPHNQ